MADQLTDPLTDHDDNPLLAAGGLPRFAAIEPEHVEPAVQWLLRTQRDALDSLRGVEAPTADWLKAFEKIHESVHRVWGPVSHLNSVVSSPKLRDAYNRCLPLITGFETELAQDVVLYRRFEALDERMGGRKGANGPVGVERAVGVGGSDGAVGAMDADATRATVEVVGAGGPGGKNGDDQRAATEAQVVRHALRGFRLAGVALPKAEKARFRELMVRLGELQASFEQNLLDSTDAFSHHETDSDELAGLPAIVLDSARKAAREKGLDGWLLALNGPTYVAVVTHADSEQLREIYYRAWATRASDQAFAPGHGSAPNPESASDRGSAPDRESMPDRGSMSDQESSPGQGSASDQRPAPDQESVPGHESASDQSLASDQGSPPGHEPATDQVAPSSHEPAFDQGSEPERRDNAPLIDEILKLRHEAAKLLGFNDYAEWSLASKMAGSPDEVIAFLRDLAARSRERARDELRMLNDYAGHELAAWDIAYYSEKLKQERFALSEEELRAYFPLPRVLDGLFALAERLFGIRLRLQDAAAPWHDSVRYYAISHADGAPLGGLYTDLFARPNKRSGAWMNTCVNRARLNGATQLPVAHLVCNFNPPGDATPALLTHNDVVTLFHEFGHSLHHLLTEIEYPSLSGINGVAWDAVELPSQFLENYAWLPEVLKEISGHHETGEPLPDDRIATLNGSRTFLSGLAMVRQLEFALFDFELHHAPEPPAGVEVRALLQRIRDEVAVVQPPDYNRFENTFAHIFAGGYAAGYYSYKWAEVLAADAFSAFEEAGAFDAATAERFRRSILAVGGSRDAMAAFVDFRGREPRLEALLRQAGIL